MKLLLLSAILSFSHAIGMEEDSNTVPNIFGGSTTTKYFTDGSSEITSTTGGGYSNVKKHYPDGSMMVEITAPDGSARCRAKTPGVPWSDWTVTRTSDVDHSGSSVKESGAKKPNTFTRINSDIKRIESFGGARSNVPSKKKENIVLNAKLHAWIQKPTDEYDHNRSRQEIDEPIRSIDNSVRKSGEYYSRTICDSMEKYSQLRKPIEMEKKIVLLNTGGFNREQLLEQMDKVTDKIEILTDEYAREFIRMRGDIPEDEIENHLEEVKQIIKDEWFKNYSHDIHMSCVVE
jgi:hypothetical protein